MKRLTVRHNFYVSPAMDKAMRDAAEQDAGIMGVISVSDWIRGAIAARLTRREAEEFNRETRARGEVVRRQLGDS